ncbi:hypothetical protein [Streptomyces asiaticus]|uniref:hypothetical protein n=1 Tax=Streptomyces asiaticus TaxID=114695 RepID=UPI003820E197
MHDVYAMAGKPAARTISTLIRERDDLPGTLSHEGVSAVLRGANVPRWANLESLVRVLVEQQRVGGLDVEAVILKIHKLWCMADDSSTLHGDSLEIYSHTGILSTDSESSETVTEEADTEASERSDPGNAPPLSPVMRWNPRQRTLDIYDRQVAVEIFREAGGSNE